MIHNSVRKTRLTGSRQTLTSIEDDPFRRRVRFLLCILAIGHVHIQHVLRQKNIQPISDDQLRLRLTSDIFSRSSMSSCLEVCTRQSATYFAVSESTFATRAVNEGRPSAPGAGWMTSALIHIVNERKLVFQGSSIPHNDRRIMWIGEDRDRARVGNGVDPTKFNIDSMHNSAYHSINISETLPT